MTTIHNPVIYTDITDDTMAIELELMQADDMNFTSLVSSGDGMKDAMLDRRIISGGVLAVCWFGADIVPNKGEIEVIFRGNVLKQNWCTGGSRLCLSDDSVDKLGSEV